MDMLKNATVSDVHSPGALGGERRKGQRRILRRLRIDEVSAVDFPAQAHARALIIKRHAPDEPEIADDGLSDTEAAIAKRAAAGESYFMAAANVYAERDRRAGESMEKARERFYSTEKGRYLREVAKAAPASWYAKPREEDKAPGPGQHARTNTPAKSRPEDRAPGAGQHAPTNTFAKPREEDKAPEGPARKSLNDRAREMMAADKRLTREKAVARIAESRSSSDQALWRNARAEARS
jgi:hypothetical protein